jgi:hypothetical protein
MNFMVLRLIPSVWQILTPRQPQGLIANLLKFALKAHAFGDLRRRDDTRLDLLAGLPGSFERPTVLHSLR